MAIRPDQLYPAQSIAGNSAYPYGSARNVTLKGDGTGFPLEKTWVNDVLGFLQELMFYAGQIPNGDPDSVDNPQYFNALIFFIQHINRILDPIAFSSLATFEGGARFVGIGINVEGPNNIFSGTTRFTAQARFTVQPVFEAGFSVSGGVTNFAGAVNFQAPVVVQTGPLTVLAGAGNRFAGEVAFEAAVRLNGGRIVKGVRYGVNGDNYLTISDATHPWANTVVFQLGVMTGAHDLFLEDSPYDGVEVEIINWTSFAHTVKTLAGSSIITVPPVVGPAIPGRMKLMWYNADGTFSKWNISDRTT